ncbi:MAG: hypothetical protein NVS3B21_19050 [Acidimicrobiales bacterium]
MTPRTPPPEAQPVRAPGAPRPGAPSTELPGAGPAAPGADPAARSAPGAYARTLLRPKPVTAIQVEILEQPGATPNDTALRYDVAMIGKVAAKAASLGRTLNLPDGGTSWTPQALAALVDRYGTPNTTGAQTAVLHLVFVHGMLANSSGVLGVAFRGDTVAIFPDQTQGQLSLNTDRVLQAVYLHETGHLLGMVDLALHENRGDPNDPSQPSAHSPDRSSVMYYAIDTTGLSTVFAGGPPIDFDAADYADFAKLRSGA